MNVGTESSVTPIAPSQVATTVQHLRRHFATGVTRDAAWRVRQLEALKRLLVERERDIVNAVKADLGRNEIDAWFGDVAPPKGDVEYALRHLKSWMKPQRRKVALVQVLELGGKSPVGTESAA